MVSNLFVNRQNTLREFAALDSKRLVVEAKLKSAAEDLSNTKVLFEKRSSGNKKIARNEHSFFP